MRARKVLFVLFHLLTVGVVVLFSTDYYLADHAAKEELNRYRAHHPFRRVVIVNTGTAHYVVPKALDIDSGEFVEGGVFEMTDCIIRVNNGHVEYISPEPTLFVVPIVLVLTLATLWFLYPQRDRGTPRKAADHL